MHRSVKKRKKYRKLPVVSPFCILCRVPAWKMLLLHWWKLSQRFPWILCHTRLQVLLLVLWTPGNKNKSIKKLYKTMTNFWMSYRLRINWKTNPCWDKNLWKRSPPSWQFKKCAWISFRRATFYLIKLLYVCTSLKSCLRYLKCKSTLIVSAHILTITKKRKDLSPGSLCEKFFDTEWRF